MERSAMDLDLPYDPMESDAGISIGFMCRPEILLAAANEVAAAISD
jgi:hypothetical protein